MAKKRPQPETPPAPYERREVVLRSCEELDLLIAQPAKITLAATMGILSTARRALAEAVSLEGPDAADDEELRELCRRLHGEEDVIGAALAARAVSHENPYAPAFDEERTLPPLSEFATGTQQEIIREVGLQMRVAANLPSLKKALKKSEKSDTRFYMDLLTRIETIGDVRGLPPDVYEAVLCEGQSVYQEAVARIQMCIDSMNSNNLPSAQRHLHHAEDFLQEAGQCGVDTAAHKPLLESLRAQIEDLAEARRYRGSRKSRRNPRNL